MSKDQVTSSRKLGPDQIITLSSFISLFSSLFQIYVTSLYIDYVQIHRHDFNNDFSFTMLSPPTVLLIEQSVVDFLSSFAVDDCFIVENTLKSRFHVI